MLPAVIVNDNPNAMAAKNFFTILVPSFHKKNKKLANVLVPPSSKAA